MEGICFLPQTALLSDDDSWLYATWNLVLVRTCSMSMTLPDTWASLSSWHSNSMNHDPWEAVHQLCRPVSQHSTQPHSTVHHSVSLKKQTTQHSFINLVTFEQFSKFFYWWSQWYPCSKNLSQIANVKLNLSLSYFAKHECSNCVVSIVTDDGTGVSVQVAVNDICWSSDEDSITVMWFWSSYHVSKRKHQHIEHTRPLAFSTVRQPR